MADNLVYDRGVLALGSGRPAEAERLFGGFLARVGPEDRLVLHTARGPAGGGRRAAGRPRAGGA